MKGRTIEKKKCFNGSRIPNDNMVRGGKEIYEMREKNQMTSIIAHVNVF